MFQPLSQWQPQAYGIWTGVLMLAAWMLNQYRLTRKLSIEDRQANREGFARQVEILQSENRALRTELRDMRVTLQERDREHDEYRKLCHAETDQLRNQITSLSDEITGANRKYDQLRQSIERKLGIGGDNGK